MPKIKFLLFFLIALVVFVPSVMAQTETSIPPEDKLAEELDLPNEDRPSLGEIDPLIMTELLAKIGESAKARKALIASTSSTEEYIATRDSTLRSQISRLADSYDLGDNKEIPETQYSKEDVIRVLELTIARYKSLNSSLYKSRLALNDSLDFINKSGFDKERIRSELYTITQLEGEIEDQTETLVYIKTLVEDDQLEPKQAVLLAQSQSNLIKKEYVPLINDFILIIEKYL